MATDLLVSSDSNDKNPLEGLSVGPSRYKLSLEEVDSLLGSIYQTLDIEEDKAVLSRHDLMYQGM